MAFRLPAARQWLMASAGLILACAGRLMTEVPAAVEWHRTQLFPLITPLLQRTTGSWTSTLGEGAAAVAIALAMGALVFWRGRVLGALALGLGLGVFCFYGLWGLGYRYPPLAARLPELREPAEGSPFRLAEAATRSAQLLSFESGQGSFARSSNSQFLSQANAGVSEGFARLPAGIEAAPVGGIRFGPFKFSRASWALTRLQLSGYYFPWSGEAQINGEMPRTLWPRVGAHEKAHQRGFARENEATVMGTLACLASSDTSVFYSGALGLFVGLDRDLSQADPEARRRVWATLPQHVIEDLRNEFAFWKAHEGVAAVVSEKVNDTYLKAQGVASGVGSYSETTRLFMQAIEGGLVDFASPRTSR